MNVKIGEAEGGNGKIGAASRAGTLGRVQAAERGGVDPRTYRRVIARYAAGVAVVTAVADGTAAAMTVSSLASVSLDPVLVLFCCERSARFHDLVLAAGGWAVSVLGGDMVDASRWFATRGRPGHSQFEGWRTVPGVVTGAPVLDGALAVLECRTWATYDGGDHTIVVGEVLRATRLRPDGSPLLYYNGEYRTLA